MAVLSSLPLLLPFSFIDRRQRVDGARSGSLAILARRPNWTLSGSLLHLSACGRREAVGGSAQEIGGQLDSPELVAVHWRRERAGLWRLTQAERWECRKAS